MFFKIGVLKNFATGKYLCWSLFVIKNAGLKVCNSMKKRLQSRCFPVDIATLKTPPAAAFVSVIK